MQKKKKMQKKEKNKKEKKKKQKQKQKKKQKKMQKKEKNKKEKKKKQKQKQKKKQKKMQKKEKKKKQNKKMQKKEKKKQKKKQKKKKKKKKKKNTSDPYCVCESGSKSFKTPVIDKTLEPFWDYEGVLNHYKVGSPLKFTVYDKDWSYKDDELGHVTLSGSKLTHGFVGELLLVGAGGSQEAYLKVAVADSYGVFPQDPDDIGGSKLKVRMNGARGFVDAQKGFFGREVSCLYAKCEIPNRARCSMRSQAIEHSGEPEWNYERHMSGFKQGDSLVISVLHEKHGAGKDVVLATRTMSCDEFFPKGFAGMVDLEPQGSSWGGSKLELGSKPQMELQISDSEGKFPKLAVPDSALQVKIVSARGLRAADTYVLQEHSSDPYCVCEVMGKPYSRFRTHTIQKTLVPTWGYKHRLRGYAEGDSLKFTVYDEDWVSQDDELGYVVLKGEEFHRDGFSGERRLITGNDAVESFIQIRVSNADGEFPNWEGGMEGEKASDEEAEEEVNSVAKEANWFKITVGAVILINTAWLLACSAVPWLREHAFWIDTAFLSVYVVETILRISHWKVEFFSHPSEAGWNWFDLIIVLAGVLEFTESLDPEAKKKQDSGKELLILRVFKPLRLLARLARFMRVIRLCRVLLTADFSWVEQPFFQSTVGMVIVLNAIVMGLETDIQSPIFEWTEQFMLAFFVMEAMLRIRHRGWEYFTDSEDRGWNILDLTIVASGVVDDWILKAWSLITQSQQQGGGLSKLMTLARLLRLMRILRLVRVVRAIRPLYMLAIGVVRAMQSMFWVLVLTFVALYALAILTTRAIGRGELLSKEADIPQETRLMFNTIADSMFTLPSVQPHDLAHVLVDTFRCSMGLEATCPKLLSSLCHRFGIMQTSDILKQRKRINRKLTQAANANASAVLNVVFEELSWMNGVNMATALHRIARHCVRGEAGPDAATPEAMKEVETQPAFKALLRAVEQQAEMALLAKDHAEAEEILPAQCASILAWSLACLDVHNDRLLAVLAQLAIPHLQDFKFYEVTNMLWAYAKLRAGGLAPELLSTIARRLKQRRRGEYKAHCLSMAIWAFTEVSWPDAWLFESLTEELVGQAETLQPQEICYICWALVGKQSRKLYDMVCCALGQGDALRRFKVQEFSNFMLAITAGGISFPGLFAKAGATAIRLAKSMKPKHIASTLSAYAASNSQECPELGPRLLDVATEQVFQFQPHELAATAKAAAKLCPEHPGFFKASATKLVLRLGELSVDNLTDLIDAFSKCADTQASSWVMYWLLQERHLRVPAGNGNRTASLSTASTLPERENSDIDSLPGSEEGHDVRPLDWRSMPKKISSSDLGVPWKVVSMRPPPGLEPEGYVPGINSYLAENMSPSF
ncbi:unnamed protein product [Effrenium voratum]|nr:unnamed protein product [Effrenium voratum]